MITEDLELRKILELFPTFDAFTEHFKPANLIIIYAEVNTIDESISEKRMTIENMNQIYTGKVVYPAIEYLNNWIIYLQDFLNINNKLTKTRDVATMIYKDYRGFYLTDLKIIFEKILRSEYGTFYGSVDSQRIISSFSMYSDERKRLFNKALHQVKYQMVNNDEQIKADLKQEIWNNLQKEKIEKEKMWPELEKRFNEQLPGVLEQKAQKLLKDNAGR